MMKLDTDPAYWAPCAGKWYFTLYMDYCLELRVNKRSVSLRLRDLTREEDCEMIPIRATNENIIFRMESSWLCSRLRLYPQAGENGALMVEWTDDDLYNPTIPMEVPAGQAIICEPAEALPEWAYGTWREWRAGFPHFVLIERVEGKKFRFAKWQTTQFLDLDDQPSPRRRRIYDYVLDVVSSDALSFNYIRKGKNEWNPSVEEVLFLDEARQRLWLHITRRVRAHGQDR